MAHGVMVTQRFLVPLFKVRVLVSQLSKTVNIVDRFFCAFPFLHSQMNLLTKFNVYTYILSFIVKFMQIKNVFDPQEVEVLINRIERLNPEKQPIWGKMNVAQMLAHVNISYEMVYENTHKRPPFLMRFLLKTFVKPMIINTKPMKKNGPTSPALIRAGEEDFQVQKERLITYLLRTLQAGPSYFEGRESLSFGRLRAEEWNILFYKHLNHHLTQFGV